MTFDLFVLPFFLGLIFLLVVLGIKYSRWINALPKADILKIRNGIFSRKFFLSIKEIFFESLLHRKMFKQNALSGWMHMSFAFGWFMLIVIGNIESRVYSGRHVNPPYYPIFLKFFVHDKKVLPFEIYTVPGFFRFSMDLMLLLILSGLVLAFIKRQHSKWFGYQRKTKQTEFDRFALTALWFIFPLRLLAESFTAGYYLGGGFLTNSLGWVFSCFLPVQYLAYPAWWAYSFALGAFFVTLPYSRYMHIPTEVLLIFLRNFGIKTEKNFNSFSEIEVNSCPRCGICIDTCQLNTSACIHDTQSIYFLRSVRQNEVKQDVAFDCLLCGRCQEICPVGINLNAIRIAKRKDIQTLTPNSYSYLTPNQPPSVDVVYFAGCMTHLTPSIKKAMTEILDVTGVKYSFLDADGTVCCGRPQMMAGKIDAAQQLMDYNKTLIQKSGAKTLVTSCPICYKVFKEDYNLNIQVLHHTQYLWQLMNENKISLKPSEETVVYHDPCELGRGSGIYEEPRQIIKSIAGLMSTEHEKADALCCGGSLGNVQINSKQQNAIQKDVLDELQKFHPDTIVTACPLCKKTLAKGSETTVEDIAEFVCKALQPTANKKIRKEQFKSLTKAELIGLAIEKL